MARPKKAVEELEATNISDVVNESEASFDVLNKNGDFVRSYSVETHGENADELAKEFANKIGGKVK